VEQRLHRIEIATHGRGLVDITDQVFGWARQQGFVTGLLTIWCRHTSASLLVQEKSSPDVRADLETFLAHLVPPAATDMRRRGQTTCPPIFALR
jgi:secondary thiamine-phosphate synthase enzyme